MYKHCATEESAQRQRQLEQCLQELMLTESYSQITIGHICDRACISRKSFYRYFSSKEGCLYALLDHAVFDGASCYLPNHNDDQSMLVIYERFFRYWKEKHSLLDALLRNNLSLQLVERMMHYTAQEENEFRTFLNDRISDAHEHSMFYIGGIMTLVLDWHQNGYQKSISQMSKVLSDLIGQQA